MPLHRGFTLIELLAVAVILATLFVLAVPRYFDWADEARQSADGASIGALAAALNLAFLEHRANDAASGEWITTVAQIETMMQTGELPSGIIQGITGSGDKLKDQRGNTYTFTPETKDAPAGLTMDPTPDPTFS